MSKAKQVLDNPVLGPLLQGLVDMLGVKGTREAIQKAAPPRSPIQDVMNQERAIRMGVREIPKVPGQAPTPEGFGGFRPVPNPPSSQVPLQRAPINMEPGFTRGSSGGVQLEPGAISPRPAESVEVEGQLRIPFTDKGRTYSVVKSSDS